MHRLSKPLEKNMRSLTSFEKLYCVSNKTVSVTKEELLSAETSLQTTFPPGYAEFILKFGEGEIANYIRLYRPKRVVEKLVNNHEVLAHDFWEDGNIRLSLEQKARLVVFADTIDSDLCAFLPERPSEIYIFPRNKTELFKVGPSFLDAVNWLSSSGILVKPFAPTYFQPWNDDAYLRLYREFPYFTIDQMGAMFEKLGRPDLLINRDDGLDFFLQRYGAHLSYLLLEDDDYMQFIIHFDREASNELLPLLKSVFQGKGFQITESNPVILPEIFL